MKTTKKERQFKREEIEKFVYGSTVEDKTSKTDEEEKPITLEELQEQEKKTKRPIHTRPLIKTGIVSAIFLPLFMTILWVTNRGRSISQQPAIESSGVSQINKTLQEENKVLRDRIDQLEIESAKSAQVEYKKAQQKTEKTNKDEEKPPVKPPEAKKTPAKTTSVRPKQQPKPVSLANSSKPVVRPKPTDAEKRQKLQAIASSMIYGGGLKSSYKDNIEKLAGNTTLVSSQTNSQLTPSMELESSLLNEESAHKFIAGTFVEGVLVHPVILPNNGGLAKANVSIAESNTPLSKGSNLQIELVERDSVLSVSSIVANIEGRDIQFDAESWQPAHPDGSPIIVSFSNQDGNSNNVEKRIIRNILRNSSNSYRTEDEITSFIIGTGRAIAEEGLGDSTTANIRSEESFITIPQDTPIKLYVIQSFDTILP